MLSNSSASRNRRKGPRRYLKLKIVLSGSDALGETFTETTETRVVTKDGGSLVTTRRLRIGSSLRVSTPDGKFNAPATIRNARHDAASGTYQCGFSFEEDVHGWVLR